MAPELPRRTEISRTLYQEGDCEITASYTLKANGTVSDVYLDSLERCQVYEESVHAAIVQSTYSAGKENVKCQKTYTLTVD